MAYVISTLGNTISAAGPNIAVGGVSGSDPYTITLVSALSMLYHPGDGMTVSEGEYRISAISADRLTLTVHDTTGSANGDPAANQSTAFDRLYNTWAAWETAISTWCAAGDVHVLKLRAGGTNPDTIAIAGTFTFNDTTLSSTGTLFIDAREVKLDVTSGSPGWLFSVGTPATNAPTLTVLGLELIGYTTAAALAHGIRINDNGGRKTTLIGCSVHGFDLTGFQCLGYFVNSSDVDLVNCKVYDIVVSGSTGHGFVMQVGKDRINLHHCLADGVTSDGFRNQNASGTDADKPEAINCAAFNCGDAFTNPSQFRSTSGYNATDDAEAVGAGTDLVSLTDTDVFVDPANNDYTPIAHSVLDGGGWPGVTSYDRRGRQRGHRRVTIGPLEARDPVIAGAETV